VVAAGHDQWLQVFEATVAAPVGAAAWTQVHASILIAT
jgi:hypothetical protein